MPQLIQINSLKLCVKKCKVQRVKLWPRSLTCSFQSLKYTKYCHAVVDGNDKNQKIV